MFLNVFYFSRGGRSIGIPVCIIVRIISDAGLYNTDVTGVYTSMLCMEAGTSISIGHSEMSSAGSLTKIKVKVSKE